MSLKNFVRDGKKILAAATNYNALLAIKSLERPTVPQVFMKPTTSYIVEGQNIIIPRGFKVNQEVELGVIIGKTCKHISEDQALDFVGGYCIGLDMTATSELEIARSNGGPWTLGKGFDTACPVSRFIASEEILDFRNVQLWSKVNGTLMQDGNTCDHIFSIPALISFISKYITLEPNDMILTGSPPGMGPVVPGDVIECGIKDVACMKFTVAGEESCS